MKMSQQDMARLLGIDARTLRNWRKERPKLYEMVLKGFAFDEFIIKSEKNLQELKDFKETLEVKSK
jgi:transcriptional regulator with XRE-family HTH domain